MHYRQTTIDENSQRAYTKGRTAIAVFFPRPLHENRRTMGAQAPES